LKNIVYARVHMILVKIVGEGKENGLVQFYFMLREHSIRSDVISRFLPLMHLNASVWITTTDERKYDEHPPLPPSLVFKSLNYRLFPYLSRKYTYIRQTGKRLWRIQRTAILINKQSYKYGAEVPYYIV